MIQHVYERTCLVRGLARVLVATDDQRIARTVEDFGGEVTMTSSTHPTGTDRVAEVNRKLGADMVINAQADEPLVTGDQLRALARLLEAGSEMCTLACPFETEGDFRDPNQVKVAMDKEGRALYFSRSPIPFTRGKASWGGPGSAFRHLGLYGYSGNFLRRYVGLPQTALEKSERLEQLRALEHGHSIEVALTEQQTLGIDVPDDIVRFEQLLDESGIAE